MVANSTDPLEEHRSPLDPSEVLHSGFSSPSSPPNAADVPASLPPHTHRAQTKALPLFLPQKKWFISLPHARPWDLSPKGLGTLDK